MTVGDQDSGRVAVAESIVPSHSHQSLDLGFGHGTRAGVFLAMTVTFADVRKPMLDLLGNVPGGSFRPTPLI
jgi:hypothetical protein